MLQLQIPTNIMEYLDRSKDLPFILMFLKKLKTLLDMPKFPSSNDKIINDYKIILP